MNQKYSIPTADLNKLAELVRARNRSSTDTVPAANSHTSTHTSTNRYSATDFTAQDKYGNSITLNSKQQEFVELALSGKSCVLIGAAGTGKTTSQFTAVSNLIQSGKAGVLSAEGHKSLQSGTPGIVVCAYTRRAVANIRRNMPADMQNNCLTIHKLLEYSPVYDDVRDPVTGITVTKMSFEPMRTAANPLTNSIRTVIVEETSMLGTDLYKQLIDALPHAPQIIFLGDIQQLPPVFGPAILGFKLLELPVIELTEVYRQALKSPIISLAHRILSANPIPVSEYASWKTPNKLTIHPWKKQISAENACNTAGQFFIKAENAGEYSPEEDIILIPFNKSFGTDELNRIIANHLAHKSGTLVHQVIAGFQRMYFSVGERVLYEKEDAIITKIEPNQAYYGASFLPASATLDYWGHDSVAHSDSNTQDDTDFILSQVAIGAEAGEDRTKKCSHVITLQISGSDSEIHLSQAGAVNALIYGYCLTVHKAQGSEWRKVFLLLHNSHNTMIQRELLYTAVTRAKEELYIICEPDTFTKGIIGQRVKGNTLAEKAEYFKGKLENGFDLEGY
jgi:ATP-dependent exoDNAse (exonuclease V) alpha subunit